MDGHMLGNNEMERAPMLNRIPDLILWTRYMSLNKVRTWALCGMFLPHARNRKRVPWQNQKVAKMKSNQTEERKDAHNNKVQSAERKQTYLA